MILRQIKLSVQDKEKLSRLKGKTGVQYWNVLCRWALCFSLKEPSVPVNIEQPADSNLEMSWVTFGGENYKLFESLVKARCIKDNLPTDNATLAKYFKLHLSRGISYLSGTNLIKSLDDLLLLAINSEEEKA